VFAGGKTAHAIVPAERLHGRAVNGEDIAMRGVPLALARHVVTVVQHLHFNAPQERHARRRNRSSPNEHARITAAAQMPPLHFEYEVFVLPERAHRARRLAGAMDNPVPHAPRLRRAIGIRPPCQIPPVEQRNKRAIRCESRLANADDSEGETMQEFHRTNFTRRAILDFGFATCHLPLAICHLPAVMFRSLPHQMLDILAGNRKHVHVFVDGP